MTKMAVIQSSHFGIFSWIDISINKKH